MVQDEIIYAKIPLVVHVVDVKLCGTPRLAGNVVHAGQRACGHTGHIGEI